MNHKLLLCTDLDRTLIPNGTQPESPQARKQFSQFVNHADITLAYVTGRDKKLVEKAIAFYNLPIPDYVIADVGATIYDINHQWRLHKSWQAYYEQDWKGKSNKDIALLFSDISELRKQEVNKQKKYKLSYYVPLYTDQHSLIALMQEKLKSVDINAELIWSVDEALSIGLLDVMPKHATKRNAIEFLMQEKQFGFNQTLFAGDSGNDMDVLQSQIKSILVANAHKDVKNSVIESMSREGNQDSVYLAKGGFRKMNGNYSAGILEGINHYMPQLDEWLEENK